MSGREGIAAGVLDYGIYRRILDKRTLALDNIFKRYLSAQKPEQQRSEGVYPYSPCLGNNKQHKAQSYPEDTGVADVSKDLKNRGKYVAAEQIQRIEHRKVPISY